MNDWIFGAFAWFARNPLMSALGICLLGLIAYLVMLYLEKRVLAKLVKKTSWEGDDKILAKIKAPFRMTIIVVTILLLAKTRLFVPYWPEAASTVLKSFLVVYWAWVLVSINREIMKDLIRRHKESMSGAAHALPLLSNLISVVVVVAAGHLLLILWKVNVTPLLASAGIVTAAVAFASKDTLANFFGGVSIFMDRPYKIGDYVVLSTGERGEVVDIGIRSTRVLTRDDVLITIPNAQMANVRVINETAHVARFRVHCKVGVSYDSDPNNVEEVMLKAINDIPDILPIPSPRVRFRSFGDSALNFEVLGWIRKPADRGRVEHILNRKVFYAFKENGIVIPFPQRVVYLHDNTTKKDE